MIRMRALTPDPLRLFSVVCRKRAVFICSQSFRFNHIHFTHVRMSEKCFSLTNGTEKCYLIHLMCQNEGRASAAETSEQVTNTFRTHVDM